MEEKREFKERLIILRHKKASSICGTRDKAFLLKRIACNKGQTLRRSKFYYDAIDFMANHELQDIFES